MNVNFSSLKSRLNWKSIQEQLAVARETAEQYGAKAQFKLGLMCDKKWQHEEAVQWYRKAAKNGNAHAQAYLGASYAAGLGVEQSDEQAAYWYSKASKSINANYNIAKMYANRQEDDEKAAQYYHKAAKERHVGAQMALVEIYSEGRGVKKDLKQALHWAHEAAKRGHLEAQFMLGDIYTEGTEEDDVKIEKNEKKALHWYCKAAEQGHADAQRLVGIMYKNGQGARLDLEEAYAWLSVAAASGDHDADEERDSIIQQFSPASLEDAKKLAARYLEQYRI